MNRNFSSTTTPQIFQKSIESNVDKRMGNIFGPQLGKKMSMFVDDLNIPEINSWGDQPTNEFFRSVIEMKGFYSLGNRYKAFKYSKVLALFSKVPSQLSHFKNKHCEVLVC